MTWRTREFAGEMLDLRLQLAHPLGQLVAGPDVGAQGLAGPEPLAVRGLQRLFLRVLHRMLDVGKVLAAKIQFPGSS